MINKGKAAARSVRCWQRSRSAGAGHPLLAGSLSGEDGVRAVRMSRGCETPRIVKWGTAVKVIPVILVCIVTSLEPRQQCDLISGPRIQEPRWSAPAARQPTTSKWIKMTRHYINGHANGYRWFAKIISSFWMNFTKPLPEIFHQMTTLKCLVGLMIY